MDGTGSAAAMDLAKMEMEAKFTARKQVANLLQRPDQLEKVDQIRRRVSRKKTSVEAMLKTAVQSQLDGVRTGMNQLQNALRDIKEIREGLEEVDTSYKSIENLGEKLQTIREANSKHSQLAAAVENLKHIFTVPETVKKCRDWINDSKLLHAHKCLADLENSRDDLLFELHKQASQSPTDKNKVKNYFCDVEKISEELAKQMWLCIQRNLITVRREPTIIVTVVRIIEREERTDDVWKKRYDSTGFLPPGRLKRWRVKMFKVLEEAVQARIEGSIMEDRTTDKMWLVKHLELIRQTTVEDLRVVKSLCSPCFPPNYRIYDKYVEMYHGAISGHLSEMVAQGLEGNENVSLLTWIDTYHSKELMGHPELKIDVSELGPLLENALIEDMQNGYLQTMKSNFQEWMGNSLRSDMKDWLRDQPPEADDKGYYNTALPVILFQMIEQNIDVASTVNEKLVKSVANLCIDELDFFCKTYKAELQVYKDRHFSNRSELHYFLHYIIANINNCDFFADFTLKLGNKYFKDSVQRSDRSKVVSDAFMKLAVIVANFLLEEVFTDLGVHMNELLTKKWVGSSSAIDTICITIEDYCQDFVHLKEKYYDKLLKSTQDKIIEAYLRAMFCRKIAFKNYDERQPAAEQISREAEQLSNLFAKLANKEMDCSSFETLPRLAELIKLRDTSMMSLELSQLGHRYPDIKIEQVVNILLMREDINRSDAKAMVTEALGSDEDRKTDVRTIFSYVAIS